MEEESIDEPESMEPEKEIEEDDEIQFKKPAIKTVKKSIKGNNLCFFLLHWDMTKANNKIKVIYLKPVLLYRALGPSGLPKLAIIRCDK